MERNTTEDGGFFGLIVFNNVLIQLERGNPVLQGIPILLCILDRIQYYWGRDLPSAG